MPSAWHWHQVKHCLRSGGVIACPTEGVWGLGCDPFDAAACLRLLELKRRSWTMGLILVAADASQFDGLIQTLPEDAQGRMQQSWPGPSTWIVPATDQVPPWVSGGRASIAVRVSAHPVVRRLCNDFGGPLVSTSANRHGRAPAMSAFQVRQQFSDALDFVLPGPLGGQQGPTSIRDALSGDTLRA